MSRGEPTLIYRRRAHNAESVDAHRARRSTLCDGNRASFRGTFAHETTVAWAEACPPHCNGVRHPSAIPAQWGSP
jgi:hypothetical protein